ncbi:hypothetical protein GPAL_1495 [Glaciecola pallidula DSM 14239 = ACAM 615]|uniref:Uncharacterized protein n=1 Tax=Brumicola pallidula DSM 14239 = ACAM 615 TaxID=1121922 RepID=K6ZDF7_9ALTE|nr:hypothetical protein GPAL_1495 [Glaciecola pallidula DSM 14239 = ACAM 615]
MNFITKCVVVDSEASFVKLLLRSPQNHREKQHIKKEPK